MSSSRKSVVYTPEFKLKVLEYYFKHGGERSFGIKSKTAAHFKIDKKTISRMLCNPEMVKKASRCLSQKKPLIMNSSKTQGGKSLPKDKHPHSGGQPQTSSVSKSIPTTGDSSRTTLPKTKTTSVDLPEDPDYSILKRMISSSVTGAANLARLLVTSTKEVQKSLLNECDLIFECKVCKNLFRSVVNFLAHKRIYCQDEFVNVKMMFSENNPLGMTSESSTIVVEPEPPPQTPPLCVGSEKESQSKIDLIAERLTSRNLKKRKFDELSSSSDKGSSDYYERLQNANASRSHVTRNCSLKLKDMLKINPHAVFQSFAAPGQEANEADIKLVKEIQQRKLGITAMMNSKGKIIDSRFGEPSSIDASSLNLEDQDSSEVLSHASSDGISAPSDGSMEIRTPEERYIYTCPICSIVFLTIGGCNKHLFNVHKKKKHQRDRLRKVIRSRAYKKTLTQDEIKALHNRTIEIKSDSPADASVEARRSQKRKAEVTEITSPLVIQCRGGTRKHYDNVRWMCNVCQKKFISRPASLAHVATHLICDFEPKIVRIEEEVDLSANHNREESSSNRLKTPVKRIFAQQNIHIDEEESQNSEADIIEDDTNEEEFSFAEDFVSSDNPPLVENVLISQESREIPLSIKKKILKQIASTIDKSDPLSKVQSSSSPWALKIQDKLPNDSFPEQLSNHSSPRRITEELVGEDIASNNKSYESEKIDLTPAKDKTSSSSTFKIQQVSLNASESQNAIDLNSANLVSDGETIDYSCSQAKETIPYADLSQKVMADKERDDNQQSEEIEPKDLLSNQVDSKQIDSDNHSSAISQASLHIKEEISTSSPFKDPNLHFKRIIREDCCSYLREAKYQLFYKHFHIKKEKKTPINPLLVDLTENELLDCKKEPLSLDTSLKSMSESDLNQIVKKEDSIVSPSNEIKKEESLQSDQNERALLIPEVSSSSGKTDSQEKDIAIKAENVPEATATVTASPVITPMSEESKIQEQPNDDKQAKISPMVKKSSEPIPKPPLHIIIKLSSEASKKASNKLLSKSILIGSEKSLSKDTKDIMSKNISSLESAHIRAVSSTEQPLSTASLLKNSENKSQLVDRDPSNSFHVDSNNLNESERKLDSFSNQEPPALITESKLKSASNSILVSQQYLHKNDGSSKIKQIASKEGITLKHTSDSVIPGIIDDSHVTAKTSISVVKPRRRSADALESRERNISDIEYSDESQSFKALTLHERFHNELAKKTITKRLSLLKGRKNLGSLVHKTKMPAKIRVKKEEHSVSQELQNVFLFAEGKKYSLNKYKSKSNTPKNVSLKGFSKFANDIEGRSNLDIPSSTQDRKNFWHSVKFPKISVQENTKLLSSTKNNGWSQPSTSSDPSPAFSSIYSSKANEKIMLDETPKTKVSSEASPETQFCETSAEVETSHVLDLSHIYSLPSTSKGFPSLEHSRKLELLASSTFENPDPHFSMLSDCKNIDFQEVPSISREQSSPSQGLHNVTIDEEELLSQGLNFGDVRYGWELL